MFLFSLILQVAHDLGGFLFSMKNLEINEFSVTGLPVIRTGIPELYIKYNDATKDRKSYLFLCKKLGFQFLHYKIVPYKNPEQKNI